MLTYTKRACFLKAHIVWDFGEYAVSRHGVLSKTAIFMFALQKRSAQSSYVLIKVTNYNIAAVNPTSNTISNPNRRLHVGALGAVGDFNKCRFHEGQQDVHELTILKTVPA